ncbi:MAG TPA: SDR family NAD(P)-dependent oxidoreductase [Bacteroidia bacterium]|jgi:benzil reductase ((S)-benzoin forming)
MKHYYITGTSRGIGRAMAECLLKDEKNRVTGISRSNSISHKNFRHVKLDLSDVQSVKEFRFDQVEKADRICLVNNSGEIGMVKPVGKLPADEIIKNYNLNLVAPCLLMNEFMRTYQLIVAEKIVVNVSSGAGKNPVDGWGMYCASKAAVDMYSRVADLEEKVRSKKNFRVLAIAPGVVDTDMQAHIRSSAKEDFSRINDFVNYKKDNILAKPEAIAEKYIRLLDDLSNVNETVIAIKDY